jgi:hypothetical protein
MADDLTSSETTSDLVVRDAERATRADPGTRDGPTYYSTIAALVVEIQDMTSEAALKRATRLVRICHRTYFELGGTLKRIKDEKWYHPHKTFKAYVADLGISYREAKYFISIFETLTRANIEWEKVEEIGWTKLVCLVDVITTQNADHWLKIARETPRAHLRQLVKEQSVNATMDKPASPLRARRASSDVLSSDTIVDLRPQRDLSRAHPEDDDAALATQNLIRQLAALDLYDLSAVVCSALKEKDSDAARALLTAVAETFQIPAQFGPP